MAKTKNALKIVDAMIGEDEELRALLDDARINADVAQLIYNARSQAGLTQRELARLIDTKQPVIAKLEDADYEGHSLTMLRKIATALGHEIEVRFRPVGSRHRSPQPT
jgi:ribosome-binding protein aMBF1 (putative translation factor)